MDTQVKQPKPQSYREFQKVKLASLVLLGALSLLVLLMACGKKSAEESKVILVGEFGSLTGTTATFGQSTHKGIAMAFDEINSKGGVIGKTFKLLTEDDQGKPEEAQTVVTKLISKDRVRAILGEVASSRSLAAAPVCQQSRIPMITPSSTNPKVTQIGDYIFRVCFIDPFQGKVMAKFAYNTLKYKKIAILRDVKNDYSIGLSDFFKENYEALGGEIVADVSYSEGDTDFGAQLTAIKSKKPEGILVPGYYTEVGLIARQARKLGLEVPLLGGDGWDSPKLYEIGGEALNGCYFSNHYSVDDPSPAIQNFVSAFKAKYQETPDALAALGYDAARLLADAITRAKSDKPDSIRVMLAATEGFQGVTGTITFDENRNPVKPAVILRIQDGSASFAESVNP